MTPDPVGPGQESVWSFSRPAIAQACTRRIRIVHRDVTIADTRASVRTLETSHPPSYYLPPADVLMAALRFGTAIVLRMAGGAVYHDLIVGDVVLRDVAWS